MRRWLVTVVVTALVAAGFGSSPARAGTETDSVETRLLELINAGRATRGKGAEVMHAGLRTKAQGHSASQASKGYLTHDGFSARISGAIPDPAEANGAPDDGFNGSACENVAYYYPGSTSVTTEQVAQKFYTLWYNSSGHQNCMFDAYGYGLNAGGTGIYRDSRGYWWATFESVRDNTPPTGSVTPPPSPTPTPTPTPSTTTWKRIEQRGTGVAYSGYYWSTISTSSASGGSYRRARNAGYKVTFTFNGTSVRWVGLSSSSSGIADVRLDGVLVATVDSYSAATTYKKFLYTRTGLAAGSHKLEVTVKGTKSASSSSSYVNVDAFDYL